jgi:hypothetical protein
MGRYYHGDIEGKFMFGVQSSNDADFFGSEGFATYLNYGFDESDKPKVKMGLKECKKRLGKFKKQLDEFFRGEGSKGYNEEILLEHLISINPKYPIICGGKVRELLEWYARYYLGDQIHNCLKKHGHCSFEAEI